MIRGLEVGIWPSGGNGALVGAASWTIYAIVEYALWSLLFWFIPSYCSSLPLEASSGLLIFAVYPPAGALWGVLAGSALGFFGRRGRVACGGRFDELLWGVATLSLPLAFMGGVLTSGTGRVVDLAVPIAVAGGVAVATARAGKGHSLPFVARPFAVSAVLLGTPRSINHFSFASPKNFVYAVALGYVVLTAVMILRPWERFRRQRVPEHAHPPRHPSYTLLTAAGTAVGLIGFSFALERAAYLGPSSQHALPMSNAIPNVILIVMDTVRADHLSAYGYARDTTPNLRSLANDSTLYARAISAADHTLSSHATLFTGMFPAAHGATIPHTTDPRRNIPGGLGLADRFVTLAEALTSAGYLTAAVVSNYGFLHGGFNLDQGFNSFAVRYDGCAAPTSLARLAWRPTPPVSGRDGSEPTYHDAARINKDVFAFLGRAAHRRNRYFLFINYMDAHWPYAPPPPFDRLFPGKDSDFRVSDYTRLRDAVLRGQQKVTPRENRHLVSQYDGGIAFLDAQIGQLIDRLKSDRLYDSSLIIVTSDHGEALGERDLLEHGVSVYQNQVHVPLIVKYPDNMRRGRVVRETVSTGDVMPTVLDVLGLRIPTNIQTRSLLAPLVPRTVIAESYRRPHLQELGGRFQGVQRAVLEGPIKLITSTDGRRELYDLDADPGESNNLYRAGDDMAVALETKLDAWLRLVAGHGDAPVVMDPQTLERLRSLGYTR